MKTASLAHTQCAANRSDLSRRLQRGKHSRCIRSMGIAAILIVLALLAACSSDSNKPTEEAKPEVKGPELLTARVGSPGTELEFAL